MQMNHSVFFSKSIQTLVSRDGDRHGTLNFTAAHIGVEDPNAKIWTFKSEDTATGEQR